MIGRRGFFRSSTALFASRLLPPTDAPAAFSEISEVSHPLDPLTSEEIREASKILRASGNWTPDSRLAALFLREPSKEEVLSWLPGAPMSRQASAVVYQRARNHTFESTIDLPSRRLLSWKQVEGVQPWTLNDDADLLGEIIRPNPEWQQAMRKRGIKDFDKVQIEPESAGYQFLQEQEGDRLVGAIFFYRGGSENPYARPITGLIVFVNLTKRTVFKILDDGVWDVPRKAEDLDENSLRSLRKSSKP
jgi:primary-amine oxidase